MTQVLGTQLSKLEKLEEFQTFAAKTVGKRQWNRALWAQNHYPIKAFSLIDHVLWFPKHVRNTQGRSNNVGLDHTYLIFLPYNITFLVIVNKFDPNPILVNINKLKPYRFQDTITSKGLESIVKNERDIYNPYRNRIPHCNPRKCTRYMHKIFIFDGWNQNTRVTTWNRKPRFGSWNWNSRQNNSNWKWGRPIGTKISTIGLKLKIHVLEPKSDIQSKQLKFRS